MPRTLKDMVVVITGASAGIDRALAEQLSAQGAKLVLAARRMERLNELNAALGGVHLCVSADVSKTDDCRGLIDQAFQRFGRIDTLVCNAGFGLYRSVARTGVEETRQIFQTNVFGTTDCIHFALPQMRNQEPRDGFRGQVMIVSSAVARRGFPFLGVYSATKAAQMALAEALRVELERSNIAVTSVHPIQTKTEFSEVAQAKGEMKHPDAPTEQSAETVAKKMIHAIVKPRPEVWPSASTRWLLGIAIFMPSLADRMIRSWRRKIERENADLKEL